MSQVRWLGRYETTDWKSRNDRDRGDEKMTKSRIAKIVLVLSARIGGVRSVVGMLLGILLVACCSTVRAASGHTVAVLEFNSSGAGTAREIAQAVPGMLSTTLAKSKRISLVERAQIKRVINEQDLQISSLVDPKTAVKIGRIVGADFVVIGSVFVLGDQLRIDSRLVNVKTGAVDTTAKVQGAKSSAFELTDDLASKLLKGITQEFVSVRKLQPISQRVYLQRQFTDKIMTSDCLWQGGWANGPKIYMWLPSAVPSFSEVILYVLDVGRKELKIDVKDARIGDVFKIRHGPLTVTAKLLSRQVKRELPDWGKFKFQVDAAVSEAPYPFGAIDVHYPTSAAGLVDKLRRSGTYVRSQADISYIFVAVAIDRKTLSNVLIHSVGYGVRRDGLGSTGAKDVDLFRLWNLPKQVSNGKHKVFIYYSVYGKGNRRGECIRLASREKECVVQPGRNTVVKFSLDELGIQR